MQQLIRYAEALRMAALKVRAIFSNMYRCVRVRFCCNRGYEVDWQSIVSCNWKLKVNLQQLCLLLSQLSQVTVSLLSGWPVWQAQYMNIFKKGGSFFCLGKVCDTKFFCTLGAVNHFCLQKQTFLEMLSPLVLR